MQTCDVPYRDGDVPLTGFLAHDERAGDRPGVLVVHGGAGLDAHARDRARRLAALGFVAFACDMYGDGVAGDRARILACIADLRGTPGRLAERARAGLAVLAARPGVGGRLAAVGYCFGGTTVLEMARAGLALSGVVSVHGGLETSRPAEPGAIGAKVLVCHGARDPHVPPAHVQAFMAEMDRAGADWQLIAYGRAMHGFTHEHAVERPSPGVAYDAAADARSSAAIQAFLAEIFGQAPAPPAA